MPQRTLPASSRAGHARPADRHPRPAHRRVSTGRWTGGAARMSRRRTGTTATAAPRIDQDAAPNSGGAGPGLGPERAIPRSARIFRIMAGSCSVAIRRSRPRSAGTPEHQARTPRWTPSGAVMCPVSTASERWLNVRVGGLRSSCHGSPEASPLAHSSRTRFMLLTLFWAVAGRMSLAADAGRAKPRAISAASNLLKVAPAKGRRRNPTGALMGHPVGITAELLRQELTAYNPTRVLVTTGRKWFHGFEGIVGTPISWRAVKGNEVVVGTASEAGRRWVIAQHPQGLPGGAPRFVTEVQAAYRELQES
jgi:hypothetical protein